MLVAAHIPAHDDERHLAITTSDEVRHWPAITRENGESEILVFPGDESGDPGTQHVTLAGDGESTWAFGVIFLADAPPVVAVPGGRGTTDNRFAEINPEAEQRNQAGEQRQHRDRGSQPFDLQFAGGHHS